MKEMWDSLKLTANVMGYKVNVVPGESISFVMAGHGYFGNFTGLCSPRTKTILISGSAHNPEATLAHEIGHAMQWAEKSWSDVIGDPVEAFKLEIDACDRGAALGVDMHKVREDIELGYAELYGLYHMGLS